MAEEKEHEYGDGLPEQPKKVKLNSAVVWMLVILPLGLLAGSVLGIYRYYDRKEELTHRASKAISSDEIRQILDNYGQRFGDRNFLTEQGRETLRSVSKNIAGELQSNNSMLLSGEDKGNHEAGGVVWKTYWADVVGAEDEKVFFVATTYEGKQSLGNAASMAVMITVAKSLAGLELDYTLRFVFIPTKKNLLDQVAWLNEHCLRPSETNLGVFFLMEDPQIKDDDGQENSWRVTGGDVNWAGELMKGSRVMHYGAVSLTHGVLDEKKAYTGGEVSDVELAAKGLREILFMVLGADR